MKLKIRQFPDPILLQPCKPVESFDKRLHDILDEMGILMKKAHGMGLAANQLGISEQFFVMLSQRGDVVEFINPEFSDFDGNAGLPEGCLSLPNYYLTLKRSDSVIIKAQNRHGETFRVMVCGLEAVCAQHEYDHLQGIFYLQKEQPNG